MGAKTGLLAFTTGGVADALRNRPTGNGNGAQARDLLRRLHPGGRIEPTEDDYANLAERTYPPQDFAYAACFPDLDIVCDRNVMVDRPSLLPSHCLEAGAGRTVVLHAMHSVVDWLAFAVWQDGVLVRSLSLSPDSGVMEDIGEHLPFETPFWDGYHPMDREEDEPDEDPYPLPFHPLELGDAALRALFGFVMEGVPEPEDIDPSEVPLHAFRLTDPDGPTPAQREAELRAHLARMAPPRTFRSEGGRLVEDDRR